MKSWRPHLLAIGLALMGFLYAGATVFVAGLMTGAGHGWMSGCVSGNGVFILPLFGAAIAYRDNKAGVALFSIALIAGAVVDYLIWHAAQQEGVEYLHKVQHALPGVYSVWLGMWSGWQIATLVLLPWSIFLNKRRNQR